jgi:nicotinamide-nucleotide amidase
MVEQGNGGKSGDIRREPSIVARERSFPNFELASRVVGTLRERGLHITTVESCTGGGLANAITNISGASEVIRGAFVTYANDQKIALGVPFEIIDEHTVYSLQTAQAMAEAGLRAAVRADIGVGITGSISRVDPNNPNSTPGVIYAAVVFEGRTRAQVLRYTEGERWEIKDKAVADTLVMVLDILNPQEDPDTSSSA